LVVGGNTVVFHPGFAGTPGALRVGGAGGFGNQDMGFVPANGTLYHVEVHQFPTGQFDITVTDGDNPATVYTNTWTNLASVGGPIGFVRAGPLGTGPGHALYDNLRVDDTNVIPEPSTFILAALGLLSLLGFGRRHK
jgi:hypothetical protein